MAPKILLFANEKGGSGKTTCAIHLIIALLHLGKTAASIDLDERQQSLTRYIENRQKTSDTQEIPLLLSEHFQIANESTLSNTNCIEIFEKKFDQLLQKLSNYDFIIIDIPGNNTKINRLLHYYADIVITPINSSFIDVDLIGKVNADDLSLISHGVYGNLFLEERDRTFKKKNKKPEWIVVHNRYSAYESLHKRNIDFALRCMSKKMDFKLIPGFRDRLIFKELFLKGLTLLDANSINKIHKIPSFRTSCNR